MTDHLHQAERPGIDEGPQSEVAQYDLGMSNSKFLGHWVRFCLLAMVLVALWPSQAHADKHWSGDISAQGMYWQDTSGKASFEDVRSLPEAQLMSLAGPKSFKLKNGALWIRLNLPPLGADKRWYLAMDESAFTNRVDAYQADPASGWIKQQAGDHIPVAKWSVRDRAPTFAINTDAAPSTVWLRMENRPAPLSPRLYLITEDDLAIKRQWSTLMIGAYLGFGLLVMFIGWVHARLYADRAFAAYVAYVACMLGFQTAFTGIGGLYFWGNSAWWNNAAPALFMLWLTASGIWFVREACSISRHHQALDRGVMAWSIFGFLFALVYIWFENEALFALLSLYGLFSVVLSIALCLWAWRQGERYAGWLFLGFLPVHIAYPFPALRSAGVMPDSWAAQYAVLIGSAIEIPLLLYILHRRTKDFSENRARLRALESTDPLTGLPVTPILRLRLRDAMRRARRYEHSCSVLLIELANHAEIVATEGREGGDKALVVAASKLSRVIRDVDTVCRVADTRFAVLIEGPVRLPQIKLKAQHIVAKGLEQASTLPGDIGLRFRLVSTMLPVDPAALEDAENSDERNVLVTLNKALDQMAVGTKRMVLHLPEGFNHSAPAG